RPHQGGEPRRRRPHRRREDQPPGRLHAEGGVMVLAAAGGGAHQLFDLLLNGIILGAIYVLLALGLNVILGLIGVINFAHAAFYMLGAYLTFSFAAHIGFLPAVAAAAVLVGLLGMVMEVSVIRPLYRRIPEHALLLTFGLTLVAEQAVRWHWGDYAKNFDPPSFLSGGFSPGGFTFPAYRLFIVAATAVVVAAVWLLLNRTSGGLVVGIFRSVLVYWWSPATELVPFLLMAGLLLVRPRGLFGVEGVFE